MADVTCVVFVPKGQRAELRHVLMTADTEGLRWRERKRLFGSEFYFTGPSALAMKTQVFVANWVERQRARLN
ncbi:MAG TPA: hypothetical protein VL358_04050 [Caulobacteraceae bacterium]|jgi:hypothetical protein|nr:hypothetical protein [Caulobacteraceae bacterium]